MCDNHSYHCYESLLCCAGEQAATQHADAAMQGAMQSIGSQGGADVLRHYR